MSHCIFFRFPAGLLSMAMTMTYHTITTYHNVPHAATAAPILTSTSLPEFAIPFLLIPRAVLLDRPDGGRKEGRRKEGKEGKTERNAISASYAGGKRMIGYNILLYFNSIPRRVIYD